MLRIEDQSIFADYEKAEDRSPSDRKPINGARAIYASRAFRRPQANAYGLPVLLGFHSLIPKSNQKSIKRLRF
jgi:hypothetical protein